MRVSNPFKEAVCIKSIAFPSAYPSLISTKTTSLAKFLIAMYSAQLAPTAPAPTTVTFIFKYIIYVIKKFRKKISTQEEASLLKSCKNIYTCLKKCEILIKILFHKEKQPVINKKTGSIFNI